MASSSRQSRPPNDNVTATQAANQQRELEFIDGTGRQEAESALRAGFQPSLDVLKRLLRTAPDITGGLAQATGTLQGGLATGRGRRGVRRPSTPQGVLTAWAPAGLQQAAGATIPTWRRARAPWGTYEASLGLGGADARTAALNAFQTGPGYQFQVDEAHLQAQRPRTGPA